MQSGSNTVLFSELYAYFLRGFDVAAIGVYRHGHVSMQQAGCTPHRSTSEVRRTDTNVFPLHLFYSGGVDLEAERGCSCSQLPYVYTAPDADAKVRILSRGHQVTCQEGDGTVFY